MSVTINKRPRNLVLSLTSIQHVFYCKRSDKETDNEQTGITVQKERNVSRQGDMVKLDDPDSELKMVLFSLVLYPLIQKKNCTSDKCIKMKNRDTP